MKNDSQPLMVSIRCLVYNHERYIRQCLEGFVMQRTNFRFEAIVHDDASTDGTVDIIREYAEKYPDIIKPIFEIENQYSKHDGSLRRIMDEHTHGKYVAVCEGDDYWIDPHKLQKQYDFMESHPECSMCFHSHFELYPSGEQKLHCPKNIKSFYGPEVVILGGGGFMATNSMFYRWSLLLDNGCPDFWKNCPIGDLPMMLFFVSKGNIGYINEPMSIYRISAINSWTSRQKSLRVRRNHHKAILQMFDEYDKYTSYQFHNAVSKKKRLNKKLYRMDVITSILSRIKRFIFVH